MSHMNDEEPRYVVCIDNSEYPASLELHKIYQVIPDDQAEQDGDFRILDESGEDYLYASSRFVRIDLPAAVRRSLAQARPA
jgi:hypothetical protein